MMGWQRLQLRNSSARPSPGGSCASVGVGKGDWPYAAPVMLDKKRMAVASSEEAEDERMECRGPVSTLGSAPMVPRTRGFIRAWRTRRVLFHLQGDSKPALLRPVRIVSFRTRGRAQ